MDNLYKSTKEILLRKKVNAMQHFNRKFLYGGRYSIIFIALEVDYIKKIVLLTSVKTNDSVFNLRKN